MELLEEEYLVEHKEYVIRPVGPMSPVGPVLPLGPACGTAFICHPTVIIVGRRAHTRYKTQSMARGVANSTKLHACCTQSGLQYKIMGISRNCHLGVPLGLKGLYAQAQIHCFTFRGHAISHNDGFVASHCLVCLYASFLPKLHDEVFVTPSYVLR